MISPGRTTAPSRPVRKVTISDSPRELVIEVDDDGRGLSEEERTDAMKRGVRLDETTPGTGLGLSIVQRLAQLLNHPVQVRSSLGKGSIFSIDVPATPHVTPQRLRNAAM